MDYSNEQYNNGQTLREQPSGFSVASAVLGIISIITCCTALLPIPVGAMGIIFAMLTYRRGKPMAKLSKVGLILSCIGFALGLGYTLYILFSVVIPMYNNPDFLEKMNQIYKGYGIDLNELLKR